MNPIVIKKTWNEILKMVLYHYINTLISSDYNGVTVLEIRIKIKSDTELISETFENLVGKNLTESTVKILKNIYEFLTVSSSMISSSIFTLRQYIGPTFSLDRAEAFIKLRTDFKEEETFDAIRECKDTLNKYNKDSKEDPEVLSYFQIIDKEMKRQEREKKLNYDNYENEEVKEEEKKDKKGENDSEEEEGEVVSYEIDDFLKADSDEELEEGKIKMDAPQEKDKDVIQEEVSDIIIEGYLEKKAASSYHERFFQLKNGCLYWFKDKNSSIIQNKILLKDTIKIDSSKSKKFSMIVRIGGEKVEEGDLNGKVYKFKCKDEETKNKWLAAINQEMERIKDEKEKTNVNTIEIKLRKKEIVDHFNLPEIGKDIYSMRREILEEMSKENYFQPSARKIEAEKKKKLKEENDKKKKELEEIEKKKRIEKEEKMKKEEQEKFEEMKKKREENKKIQDDIKKGKSVGFADKIKLWYRTNIEGMKEEDNNTKKPDENKDEKCNEMKLDDFLSGDN